jgi:cell wall-associated NlpC family hydrolase
MSVDRGTVVAGARGWCGTPYHAHARIKGVGVDCAQLLIAVYADAGAIEPFDAGTYSTQWHLHNSEELFVTWIERFADLISESEVLPGDVVLYRFGRTFSHGAIVTEWPLVVHAWMRSKCVVEEVGTAGYCENRERRFYRIRGVAE